MENEGFDIFIYEVGGKTKTMNIPLYAMSTRPTSQLTSFLRPKGLMINKDQDHSR